MDAVSRLLFGSQQACRDKYWVQAHAARAPKYDAEGAPWH